MFPNITINIPTGARLLWVAVVLLAGTIVGATGGFVVTSYSTRAQIESAQQAATAYKAVKEMADENLKRVTADLGRSIEEKQRTATELTKASAAIQFKDSQIEKLEKDKESLVKRISDMVAAAKAPPRSKRVAPPRDQVLDDIPRATYSDQSDFYFSAKSATLVAGNRYSIIALPPHYVESDKYACAVTITDLQKREQETTRFTRIGLPGTLAFGDRELTFVLMTSDSDGCSFQLSAR